MAMDKEKLLAYFQAHYLSRQEVLFKLPFSFSIESFWPELVNRRKAGAVVLPLYNASGMPYWYVLTDKMVAASERLCEEAISQETNFDPYRAGMTSAMTEEMFFTSFVEGAQIPLQEAMDFLQRGTEPENIQEQMIWNNRHAWAEMMAMLYRPLDEQFIKELAFMLTEEMDGCAEDYRQADNHPIAAMNTEPYDVPPSYSLPDRMREYCGFLQNPDIHPLIKAATAQAYILVVRPFPEGNERLSRMMSSAVLLRSGYDFFRDISISSVIARENYHYYKSMCDIIRPENGGDMTYFIEYYLGLLVRALDSRNERQRRRELEALERERQMAKMPLKQENTVPATIEAEPEEYEEPVVEQLSRKQHPALKHPVPLNEYLAAVDKLKYSPNPKSRETPARIRKMVGMGIYSFTTRQWADIHGIDRKVADFDCRRLYERGWFDRKKGEPSLIYSFRITEAPDPSAGGQNSENDERSPSVPIGDGFHQMLKQFECSKSEGPRQIAKVVSFLIEKGIYEFTAKQWISYSGMSKKRTRDACDAMVQKGLILNTGTGRPALYRLNFDLAAEDRSISPIVISKLQEMAAEESSDRDKRIGNYLLGLIESGETTFTTEAWEKEFQTTDTVSGGDIRRALNLGLISKDTIMGTSSIIFRINSKPAGEIRGNGLTQRQKDCLMKIYCSFKKNSFVVEDCAKVLGQPASTTQFHLNNLAERGLVHREKNSGKASVYHLAISPDSYPECFPVHGKNTPAARRTPIAAAPSAASAVAI